MLQRLYVNNFRCLENFTLELKDHSHILLIGKNGAGKSTLKAVLEKLCQLARGTTRLNEVFHPGSDFYLNRKDSPIRFELEVLLQGRHYIYSLAIELPPNFKEMRILQEKLSMDGSELFSREHALVVLQQKNRESKFSLDWHLAALPIIQTNGDTDPISTFRSWLGQTVILAPSPDAMSGDSIGESLIPNSTASNFASWFSGIISHSPSSYSEFERYLQQVLPDLIQVTNPSTGSQTRSLSILFQNSNSKFECSFDALSSGERIFFLCAALLAANKAYGPFLCFWDEVDAHLAPSEVGFMITCLKQSFQWQGQLMVTSQNVEAIRHFTEDSTFVLQRLSHLEPTQLRILSELEQKGNLLEALIRGDFN